MASKTLFLVAAFCAFFPAGAALAEEPSGCDAFKWPIARDQAALAAEALPSLDDGGAIAYGAATTVRLASGGTVKFRQPPERAPGPQTYGAVIELLAPPAPGVYRVSLSAGAWLDAIQDGVTLKPLAFSGARDCPHIRKTLKFQLSDKPVTIQISNVAGPTISVVVLPE